MQLIIIVLAALISAPLFAGAPADRARSGTSTSVELGKVEGYIVNFNKSTIELYWKGSYFVIPRSALPEKWLVEGKKIYAQVPIEQIRPSPMRKAATEKPWK